MLYLKKINHQARLTVACMSLFLMGAPDALADTKDDLKAQIFQVYNAVSGSLKSMLEVETEISFRTLNKYSYSEESAVCCRGVKSITVIDFLRFGRDYSNLVLGLNLVDSKLLISKGEQWQMSLGVQGARRDVYGSDNMGVMVRFQAFLH